MLALCMTMHRNALLAIVQARGMTIHMAAVPASGTTVQMPHAQPVHLHQQQRVRTLSVCVTLQHHLQVLYKLQLVKSRMEYQIRREVEIQTNLRHRNILRMFAFFDDEDRIYLVLEAAPGGEVYKALKESRTFSEARAARYMLQMVHAFKHCHKKHVIHRYAHLLHGRSWSYVVVGACCWLQIIDK